MRFSAQVIETVAIRKLYFVEAKNEAEALELLESGRPTRKPISAPREWWIATWTARLYTARLAEVDRRLCHAIQDLRTIRNW